MRNRDLHAAVVASVLLAIVAAMSGGCSKPPTEEMLRAEKSVAGARDRQAQVYAPDELAAVDAEFGKARDLVAARKYDEARSAAARVEELAHQAGTLAEIRREELKADAERMIGDLRSRLDGFRQRIGELTGKKTAELRARDLEQLAVWEAEIGAVEADLGGEDLRGLLARLAAVREDMDRMSGTVGTKHQNERKKGGP